MTTHEGIPEEIPTKEGVETIIRSIIGKIAEQEGTEVKEGEVTIERYDEQGLYAFEITVSGESVGEKIEYTYVRKGNYPDGYTRLTTGIDAAYYDDNGEPCGGPHANVAEYENGEWREII